MNSSKSFPALVKDAFAIAEIITDAGGLITPEAEAFLDHSNQALGEKADAYGIVMFQLEAQIAAAKSRLLEWDAFIRSRENALDNMRQRLIAGMQALEIAELGGNEVTFRLQANPPSCVIENEALLPPEFVSTFQPEPVKKIDKRQIIEALKIGMPVAGARMERTIKLIKKVGTTKHVRKLNGEV